jgi:hypothetical protein
MLSHKIRRITSAHAAFSLHSLTTRHLTARPSSLRLVGRSVSSRRQIQRLSNGTLTQTVPNPASTMSSERSEDMRPSRPCLRLLCPRLALLLSLMLPRGGKARLRARCWRHGMRGGIVRDDRPLRLGAGVTGQDSGG